MIARIQVRRDSESNWTANNPILTLGEIGYDTDTEKFKVGISSTSRWNDLPYQLGQWDSDASGNISYGYASHGPTEGNVSIKNDLFVDGSLTVLQDLTVKGTTATINTVDSTFKDVMIQLNYNVDDNVNGGPYLNTLKSGFEVNRGNVPNIGQSSQQIYWHEDLFGAGSNSGVLPNGGAWVIDSDLNVLGDIYSNGIALWRLNGNDIYFDNGYVGIGLDNPSSILHIKDVAPIITLEDENNPAHIWQVGQNADKFFINTETAADGSMFSMLDDGKVGIGAVVPLATLHLKDNTPDNENICIRFENDAQSWDLCNRGGDSDKFKLVDVNADTSPFIVEKASPTSSLYVKSDGNVGIGTSAPSAKLTVNKGDDIGFIVQDNTTDNHRLHMMTSASDNGYYIGYASGQSEGYKLNSSGDSYFLGGNVGIGTNAPSAKLSLNDTESNTSLTLQSNNASRWWITADGTTTTPYTNVLKIGGIGNSEPSEGVINIDGSGNVGIGTTPSQKLHVAGSIRSDTLDLGMVLVSDLTNKDIKSSSITTNELGHLSGVSSNIQTQIGNIVSSQWVTSNNDIYYNTGNVGINTTTPSEKLEVLGNIKATNNISSATTKTYQITSGNEFDEYFYLGKLQHNNGTNGYANIVVYNHVDYGLHNNTRLEVQINQRSGVFTGNAILYGSRVTGENVDILCYEDSASQNIYVYAKSDSYALSIIEVTHMGGSDWQISQNSEGTTEPISSGAPVDGGTEIFSSADNIDFMISNNGFVGINTLSPSEKLSVVGNIIATGTITSASDIKLKENIELISDPIEKVKELSGYTFNKKGEDLRLVGLIAQEVEKVLPEAVTENNEGLKGVAYGNLVALLVECVKKQDERIESLERTIEEMK